MAAPQFGPTHGRLNKYDGEVQSCNRREGTIRPALIAKNYVPRQCLVDESGGSARITGELGSSFRATWPCETASNYRHHVPCWRYATLASYDPPFATILCCAPRQKMTPSDLQAARDLNARIAAGEFPVWKYETQRDQMTDVVMSTATLLGLTDGRIGGFLLVCTMPGPEEFALVVGVSHGRLLAADGLRIRINDGAPFILSAAALPSRAQFKVKSFSDARDLCIKMASSTRLLV